MLAAVGRLQITDPFRMAHVLATPRRAIGADRSTPLDRARWHPGPLPISPGDSKEGPSRGDRPDHQPALRTRVDSRTRRK